jgi:hypothetical protein
MGCDYYIIKLLQIYYNDEDYLDIELERERGDYYWEYDEDEDDYDEKVAAYKKDILTPRMQPIMIYNDGAFKKPMFETKYETLVKDELTKYGKNWTEITRIVKVEQRYER